MLAYYLSLLLLRYLSLLSVYGFDFRFESYSVSRIFLEMPIDVEHVHPARHMGYHADLRKSSRNPQTFREMKEKISSAQSDRSTKLPDQLKLEKPISKSYGDLHHEVKQAVGDGPLFPRKSFGHYQKQSFDRKDKEDELVKHMSNLPHYLQRVERGENLQEKVLNFGVLDWGRLENWKYNQKPSTQRSVIHSPSSSNTSSPFSTVGSSTLSTRSDSGNLAHRKQSPSPGAHSATSSRESHSVVVKPSRENVTSLQDDIKVSKKASVGQPKHPGANVSSQRNHSNTRFEKGMINDVHPKLRKEMGTASSTSRNYDLLFSPKGKTKIHEGAYTQKRQQLEPPASQHCPRDKTIVLLLPKNFSNSRVSGASPNAEAKTLNTNKNAEASRSSFSDGFRINEHVQFSELYSGIPHSCPQLSRNEHSKQMDTNLPRYANDLGSKVPSGVSHFLPNSGELHTVRSENTQAKENNLTTKPTDLTAEKRFEGSSLKAEEIPSARRGNQSPNRWASGGRGKISRSLSFKEGSALPQLSSTYFTTKSGPVESDACADSSNRKKSTTNVRGRSSPLRRLLDPLLRSKTASRLPSVEPLRDEANTVCKVSDRPFPSPVQAVNGNTNVSSSTSADTKVVRQLEKRGASMVQALLQVTVKNGLPWFTFAVDNNSDILAATMKKTNSSEKYDCSWTYTFYSFHKTKKKTGGWMGHGSKGRNPDYVPNIVGQMKVTGSRHTKSTKRDFDGHLTVREFVLFDVKPKKPDQETPNLLSSVELAAIVIKVPTEITGSLTSAEQPSSNQKVLSTLRLPECSLNQPCSHNKVENLKSGSVEGPSSIVVVLPSGVHGLSATGFPSPLLDRWKSGGSCDCGGWDEGCQLRFLSNQDPQAKYSRCTKLGCDQDKFDLFVQGGGSQEGIPSFGFATCNNGVHSIDFSTSMSSLQAFSICIAFLHCKNLAKVSNLFQDITAQEPIPTESERMKLSTQIDDRVPSGCGSFPPPSPVGRV